MRCFRRRTTKNSSAKRRHIKSIAEVRGQIAELKSLAPSMAAEGQAFHLCNLPSNLCNRFSCYSHPIKGSYEISAYISRGSRCHAQGDRDPLRGRAFLADSSRVPSEARSRCPAANGGVGNRGLVQATGERKRRRLHQFSRSRGLLPLPARGH